MTPEDDVRELRKALEAGPTDGPWIEAGPSYGNALPVHFDSVVQDIEGDDCASTICRHTEDADAAYIAAASPDRIRRILDRLEAAEKDAARYEWLRRRVPGGTYRIMGVIYSEGGAGVDAAIDAAMKGQP